MSEAKDRAPAPHAALFYHFCRLRLPGVSLPAAAYERHLARGFDLFQRRQTKEGGPTSFDVFLENFHVLDWFLACACLEGQTAGWEQLFAARASRTDCLLLDALRARAVRLFPRD